MKHIEGEKNSGADFISKIFGIEEKKSDIEWIKQKHHELIHPGVRRLEATIKNAITMANLRKKPMKSREDVKFVTVKNTGQNSSQELQEGIIRIYRGTRSQSILEDRLMQNISELIAHFIL